MAPEGWQDDDEPAAAAAAFSAEDMREELERLRKDEQPAAAIATGATGSLCVLAGQVPDLPEGLRITEEGHLRGAPSAVT